MHKRFATQNAKEGVAHLLGLVDRSVECIDVDLCLFGGNVHPTALAAQVAAINDGKIEERREEFALLETPLMLLDTSQAFPARCVEKIPQQPLVRLPQESFRHPKVHEIALVVRARGVADFERRHMDGLSLGLIFAENRVIVHFAWLFLAKLSGNIPRKKVGLVAGCPLPNNIVTETPDELSQTLDFGFP